MTVSDHDDQQAVRELLASRPAAEVPPDLAARVMARIDDDGPRWLDVLNWRLWTYRLAPVAVALLLAAALGSAPTPSSSSSSEIVEFDELVDAWTADDHADTVPMFTLFGQPDVTDDELLEAVLSAAPDEERWE